MVKKDEIEVQSLAESLEDSQILSKARFSPSANFRRKISEFKVDQNHPRAAARNFGKNQSPVILKMRNSPKAIGLRGLLFGSLTLAGLYLGYILHHDFDAPLTIWKKIRFGVNYTPTNALILLDTAGQVISVKDQSQLNVKTKVINNQKTPVVSQIFNIITYDQQGEFSEKTSFTCCAPPLQPGEIRELKHRIALGGNDKISRYVIKMSP